MKKGVQLLAVTVFALSIILGFRIPDVSALKCASPRPVIEEMEYSTLTFKGTLVAESNNILTFQVSKWWKGDSSQSIVMLHSNFWTFFERGEEYVVFAGNQNKQLSPLLCGNTGPAKDVNTELLGPGTSVIQPIKSEGIEFEAAVLGTLIITIMSAIGAIRRFF
ncbi:hypothetical protein ACK8P5_02875 [Paenibacillus sp. EC2-1]|uniref:hypothetical protein n=1 Tax=Paenibacillus sp. EC2-1 TaxID=3388665 RepID=UPI003BEEC4B6